MYPQKYQECQLTILCLVLLEQKLPKRQYHQTSGFGYTIVGDNYDTGVKPRYMRSDNQAKDLHYFHLYAVRDRVDLSGTSEEPPSLNPDINLSELLPEEVRAKVGNYAAIHGTASARRHFKPELGDLPESTVRNGVCQA